MTEFEPGDRVDRYEIQRLIGNVDFTIMYLATDMDLGRRVTIKITSDEHIGGGCFVAMEGQAVEALEPRPEFGSSGPFRAAGAQDREVDEHLHPEGRVSVARIRKETSGEAYDPRTIEGL